MKEFHCVDCYKNFKAVGYENPAFYADMVADCPECGSKCWERTIKITMSEEKRLNKLKGVRVRRFN